MQLLSQSDPCGIWPVLSIFAYIFLIAILFVVVVVVVVCDWLLASISETSPVLAATNIGDWPLGTIS